MSEATASQEPSMEEILASIRRIISEEGQEQPESDTLSALTPATDTAPAAKPQPPKPAAQAPMLPQKPAPTPAPAPVAAPPQAVLPVEDDDDDLVLTEVVTSTGEPTNVVPLKPEAKLEMAAEMEPLPAMDIAMDTAMDDDEIELALDDVVSEPIEPSIDAGSLVEPEPEMSKKVEAPAAKASAARGWAEPQPERKAAPAAKPAAPVEEAAPFEEDEFAKMSEELPDLVAPEVANAATASFAQLLQPAKKPEQERPTGDGLLVETLVRNAVEPLLKAWLDTHLEPIVERIVRREVERISRKAELG